jgi:hypothetical protein
LAGRTTASTITSASTSFTMCRLKPVKVRTLVFRPWRIAGSPIDGWRSGATRRRIRGWPLVGSGSRSCVRRTWRNVVSALDRGRGGQRGLGGDPCLQAIDFRQQARQRISLRRRVLPVDVQGRFEARCVEERQARRLHDLGAGHAERLCGTRHDRRQRATDQIPRILNAPRPEERRRIQRRSEMLPAEAAAPLRQGHGLVEEALIEVVRDQPLPKRH